MVSKKRQINSWSHIPIAGDRERHIYSCDIFCINRINICVLNMNILIRVHAINIGAFKYRKQELDSKFEE